MDLNGPFKMLQSHTPDGVTPFWGPLQAACLQKADDIYYHEVVHLFTKRCFLEANQPFWREGKKPEKDNCAHHRTSEFSVARHCIGLT